jgi:hypothetical protein
MQDLPRVVPVETPSSVGADLSAPPHSLLPGSAYVLRPALSCRLDPLAMFDRVSSLGTWGLVADPRVWLLIVILGIATFGRSGLFRSRWFNLLKPWKTRPPDRTGRNPSPEPPRVSPLRDPWFLFLLVLSATAVASWIVMSLTASGRNRP